MKKLLITLLITIGLACAGSPQEENEEMLATSFGKVVGVVEEGLSIYEVCLDHRKHYIFQAYSGSMNGGIALQVLKTKKLCGLSFVD